MMAVEVWSLVSGLAVNLPPGVSLLPIRFTFVPVDYRKDKTGNHISVPIEDHSRFGPKDQRGRGKSCRRRENTEFRRFPAGIRGCWSCGFLLLPVLSGRWNYVKIIDPSQVSDTPVNI
jgi:hypothetical protein